MTANQINYYKARTEAEHYKRSDKENKRHNEAGEAIQSQANAIQEWWNQQQNKHLIRSDAINQAHYERQDAETQRHNIAEEGLKGQSNQINYLNYLSERDYKVGTLDLKRDEYNLNVPKVYAETSKIEADTALSKEKTKTEKTQQALNKTKKTESASKALNLLSGIPLNIAKAAESGTKAGKNVVDMFGSIIQLVPSIIGLTE